MDYRRDMIQRYNVFLYMKLFSPKHPKSVLPYWWKILLSEVCVEEHHE
jgi:hypothetical protein